MSAMATSPPPEAQLLEEARKRRGLSQNRAGDLAGVSGTRWRQIVGGTWQTTSPKVVGTVAEMARVVGITPQEMREAGRSDIADAMEFGAPVEEKSPSGGSGRIKGGVLRPNEELWWDPQDPSLPGSPATRYTYRWTSPEDPADYIESSKGMDPDRDPMEVVELFREMLAKAHGDRVLDASEDARKS